MLAPQLGHSLLLDEAPIGMKAAKSGKTVQNVVCSQSTPPKYSDLQIRYDRSAIVAAAYSAL